MPSFSVNGCDIYYTEQGSGDKTMLFAHGLLMDNSMWDELVPTFAETYRVIRFDFRGQGQSSNPDNGFDMDTLVEDIAAFIQARSVHAVHYVGLSMGGMVGMRIAARYPKLLRTLVLLDTSALPEPWYKKIKYRLMSVIVQCFGVGPVIPSTLKLMFGHSTFKNPEKTNMLAHWKNKLSTLNNNILGPVMGVMLRPDASHELANIICPTLIVVGEEDGTTPMHCAQHLDAHIMDAELAVIENCGHSSALEKPEQVLALMQQFYSRLRNA